MLATDDRKHESLCWIQEILHLETSDINLRDGVVLIQLINKITGKQLKFHKSKLPFMCMENISVFLKEIDQLGVPKFEQFQTVDLFEEKNLDQVWNCLIAFSRVAFKKGLVQTCLGPRLVEANVRDFTNLEKTITVPILTGHTSKLGSVDFGGRRQIGGKYKEGVAECEVDQTSQIHSVKEAFQQGS